MTAGERTDAVAVIGMACTFPGAADVGTFWANIRDGVESIRRCSAEELATLGFGPERLHPRFVAAGGVLDDISGFDAGFFGLGKREAEVLDPQQRLFLECAWHALEDAGQDPARYPGAIGVFAGSGFNTYLLGNLIPHGEALAAVGPLAMRVLSEKDFLPLRASYHLGLRGPSMGIQTACSTSLVAVHVACQALLDFECDQALAGGVSVSVPHRPGYIWQEGSIVSADGYCRPFDARAGGTVPGAGVGVVVLKRLEDALADGDAIRAVVVGSAVNNDASDKVGFTAPSVRAQAEVIGAAQARAGVDVESIRYLEAHGTATRLGDPIEIEALCQAFRKRTRAKGFCTIGSVKANIGHADAAAGIAGFIKACLVLEHATIPANPHGAGANPELKLELSPFRLSAGASPWPESAGPRRAAVSSFGMGGTNAHVILEQAPETAPSFPEARPELLVLSARTETALAEAARRLRACLESSPDVPLADIAYTLQTGRRVFPHRLAFTCSSTADAVAKLAAAPRRPDAASCSAVVFGFPPAWPEARAMGALWHADDPDLREEIDRCCGELAPLVGAEPARRLFGLVEPEREPALDAIAALVLGLSLARCWLRRGVAPEALIASGQGEAAALCFAGAYALPDVARAMATRASNAPAIEQRGLPPSTASPRWPTLLASAGGRLENGATAWDPRRLADAPMLEWVRPLFEAGSRSLLQIGPGTLVEELHRVRPGVVAVTGVPAMGPAARARSSTLLTLGALWEAGADVSFAAQRRPGTRRRRLPGYPFERQVCWIEAPALPNVREERLVAALATPASPDTALVETVRRTWREVLGDVPLADDTDFFDAGGDSVLIGEVLGRLQDELGVTLPIEVFLDEPKLSSVCAALARKLSQPAAVATVAAPEQARREAEQATIRADALLDAEVRPTHAPAGWPPREILLTGATGFLGGFLLQSLLEQSSASVTCLVRAPDAARAEERLARALAKQGLAGGLASRVRVLCGDVAAPALGLDARAWDALAEQSGLIVHAAAWVNFVYPYSRLRASNVLAVKELLRLAVARQTKRIALVSSVAAATGGQRPILEDPADATPEGRLTGYAQSKWSAERLVEVARGRGLSALILRADVIGGDGRTGFCNERDFVWALIKSSIQLGAAPDTNGTCQIVPVDWTANAVASLALRPEVGAVIHLVHPRPLAWREVFDVVRRIGYDMVSLPPRVWLEKVRAAGADNALAAFGPSLFSAASERQVPEAEPPLYSCQRAASLLPRAALPDVADVITSSIGQLIRSGFLPRPNNGSGGTR